MRQSIFVPQGAVVVAIVLAGIFVPDAGTAGQQENLNRHRLMTACRTVTTPSIDGVLDDACWQDAVFVSGLRDNREWTLLRPLTALAVAYDAQAIYFGIIADEPNPNAGRTRYREDGKPLWQDDCIEIFVSPDNDGQHYRQFLVNLAGARWFAAGELLESGRDAFEQRDPGPMRAAVKRGEDGWVMEIAVPWTLLETASVEPGTTWGFNWRRYRYIGDAGLIHGWSRLPNIPARPDRFGRLLFVSTTN